MTGFPKPDYSNLQVEFGSYVQVFEPNSPTNMMKTRTTGTIIMNPTGNAQGEFHFLSLVTGHRLSRQQWDALPMPDGVIERVEVMGAIALQPYMGDGPPIFEWSPGIPILDQDTGIPVAVEPLAQIDLNVGDNEGNVTEVNQDETLADLDEADEDTDEGNDDGENGHAFDDGNASYHPGNSSDNDYISDPGTNHSNDNDGNDPNDGWVAPHEEQRSMNLSNIDPHQKEVPIPLEQRSKNFPLDVDQRSDTSANNNAHHKEDTNNNANGEPDTSAPGYHNQPETEQCQYNHRQNCGRCYGHRFEHKMDNPASSQSYDAPHNIQLFCTVF